MSPQWGHGWREGGTTLIARNRELDWYFTLSINKPEKIGQKREKPSCPAVLRRSLEVGSPQKC
jgi:hypothetical protein